MRKKKIIALLVVLLGIGNICSAQLNSLAGSSRVGANKEEASHKQEIKSFKDMNEKLLKSIKKEYKKDPEVEFKGDQFFIVVKGKVNKKNMIMLFNDNGDLLTPDPIISYAPFSEDKNYVCITDGDGANARVGIVDYRTGQVVLPPKYSKISIGHAHDAGKNARGVWVDAATTDTWIAYDPAIDKTVFLTLDGKNTIKSVNGGFNLLCDDYVVVGKDWNQGLYTKSGNEVFPPGYATFVMYDGFVITLAPNPSLTSGKLYYGGKTIKPGVPRFAFNNDLFDLKLENGIPVYKCHRDDDWIKVIDQPAYTIEYLDEGQKYYDNGEYDKVISYYEGEGIDAPHGCYYMGLASKAIGDAELAKLDNVISTLNSSDKYYLPIENPNNYTFNATLLGSQFIFAQDYFDRFLRNNEGKGDDPMVKKAKKYRGECAVAKNSVARKMEDYSTAFTAASQKHTTNKTNAAIKKAQEDALSNSIATGITNMLFGK